MSLFLQLQNKTGTYYKCTKDTIEIAIKDLPNNKGDSFLLLILLGEAPCSSSVLTISTSPD